MAKRFIISKYVERQKVIDACVRTQKEVAKIISEDGVYHTENAENIAGLLRKFEVHVAATPCADVAPIVHGKWEDASDLEGVVCSVCGEDFCVFTNENERFKYCPNCGARMDKEKEPEG